MDTTLNDETRKLFLGKVCKISILSNGTKLLFTGTILSYSDDLIVFRDKYNKLCSFNSSMVTQIQEVQY